MNSKKKKIILIVSIIIVSFVVISFAYTLVTGDMELFIKNTTGSVKIETLNLSFTDKNGNKVSSIEPADICSINWQTKNIGTAGILTRHTLEIYWNEETPEKSTELLSLYPANMNKEQILEDNSNTDGTVYAIKTEKLTKQVDGKTVYGIKYIFTGDMLDGTDKKGISKEVDYNIAEFEKTTDDNEAMQDSIAFKLLLSPEITYLYQSKKIHINVVTEAMQYVEDGNQEWKVVDVNTIQ